MIWLIGIGGGLTGFGIGWLILSITEWQVRHSRRAFILGRLTGNG